MASAIFKHHRLLCLVGVIRAAINLQLGSHLAAQLGLGQHPLDCLFDDLFRTAGEQANERLFAQAAGEAGVAAIDLLLALQAGQPHFVGVDDDDVVAHVHERGVFRAALAAQHAGRLGGQTAQRLAAGVHHEPLTGDIMRARHVSRHLPVPSSTQSRTRGSRNLAATGKPGETHPNPTVNSSGPVVTCAKMHAENH